MYIKLISLLAICYFVFHEVNGSAMHPHEHPEIKIIAYSGKLDPKIMSFFRGAEIFSMIDSNVTEVTGNIYKTLTKLRVLYLENNVYEKVEHENVLKDAPNLEEFYFINISWLEPNFEVFREVHKLKKIVIRNMNVHYTENKVTANAFNETQLTSLEISNSGLQEFDDLAFNNLGKLEYLNLSGNEIKTIKKKLLEPLKSLKILDLSNNLIEKFTVDNLPNLPNLEEINLKGNQLKNVDQTGFDKVAPKLKIFKN